MSWGEIYNTSWWGVALDTARTVKARPDFFGSQLNLLTSEQPNLVVNGDFATDSDWSKGAGWSIEDGVATLDGTQVGGSNLASSIMSVTSGKTYKVVVNVISKSSGFRLYDTYGVIAYGLSVGENVFYRTVTSSTYQVIPLGLSGATGSIDNVSVQVARAELDQIEAKKCLADWIHTTALKDLNN